jgi:hypothetical protein
MFVATDDHVDCGFALGAAPLGAADSAASGARRRGGFVGADPALVVGRPDASGAQSAADKVVIRLDDGIVDPKRTESFRPLFRRERVVEVFLTEHVPVWDAPPAANPDTAGSRLKKTKP